MGTLDRGGFEALLLGLIGDGRTVDRPTPVLAGGMAGALRSMEAGVLSARVIVA